MSLMLIGDSMQTLYCWRNARPDLLEHMGDLVPGVQNGYALKNYRSPKQLVLLSNYFAELFADHKYEVVPSVPHLPTRKGCLSVRLFDNSHQEIRYLIKDIIDLNASGVDWKQISILSRTNKSLLDLEAGLIAGKVPYTVKYDSRSVMNQSPFKVMYSIYSLMFNPKDINSFCEILLPVKGIGPKFLDELRKQFYEKLQQTRRSSVLDHIQAIRGKSKQWETACNFINQVLRPIRAKFKSDGCNFLVFNREVWGILQHFLQFDKARNENASFNVSIEYEIFMKVFNILNNIYKVMAEDLDFMRKTELERFLEVYQSLSLSQDAYSSIMQEKRKRKDDKNRVNLNTVHSFKGRQNDYIYVANLRPIFPVDYYDFETKCVFYVAATRAKKKLTLSFSENVLTYSGQLRTSPENKLLLHYLDGIDRLREELANET